MISQDTLKRARGCELQSSIPSKGKRPRRKAEHPFSAATQGTQIPMAGRIESGEGDFVFRETVHRAVPWEVEARAAFDSDWARGVQARDGSGDDLVAEVERFLRNQRDER